MSGWFVTTNVGVVAPDSDDQTGWFVGANVTELPGPFPSPTAPATDVSGADFAADIGRGFELSEWSTTSEITTDLPAEVREAPGYAAAAAEVTVSPPPGAERGYFSPRKRGLSLGNVPCTLTLKQNAVTAPGFTGKITGADGATSSEQLNLSLEDALSDLRGQVMLPGAVNGFDTGFGWRDLGLSPLWAMDTILRGAGFCTMPPKLPGAIYSAPLQDSLWLESPTVRPDRLDGGITGTPTFERTVFGKALTLGDIEHPVRSLEMPVGTGLRFAVTVAGGETGWWADLSLIAYGATFDSLWVRIEDDELTIKSVTDGGSTVDHAVVSHTGGRIVVDVERTTATLLTYTVTDASGVLDTGTSAVGAGLFSTIASTTVNTMTWGTGIAGVQVTTDIAADPDLYLQHESQTDLADPIGTLTAIPVALTGRQKEVLAQIAEAEFGAFWMSPGRVPTFRNRDQLRGVSGEVSDVTAAESLAEINWSMSADSIRSAVEVPVIAVTVSRQPASTEGPRALAWEADSVIHVPAGERVEMFVDTTASAVGVSQRPAGVMSADPDPDAWSFFRCNSTQANDGTTDPGGCEASVELVSASRLKIVFRGGDYDVWLQDTNGDPCFKVRAYIVTTAAESVLARAENSGIDADVLTLTENPWRQSLPVADELAQAMAARLRSPLPLVQTIRVVPDITRQMGDVVLLHDPIVTDYFVRCLIVGMNRSGRAEGITEELSVRELPWLISDFNTARTGDLISDFNTLYAGRTITDFAVDPLGRD